LNGIQVGSLFQEQKIFDVVVWSTPKTRGSLAEVDNLLIDTPFDVPVRLADVARTRLVSRPSIIRHEDVSRYVDLGLGVSGRDPRSVMEDIQDRLRQFPLPLEYHAEVFGASEQQRAGRNRLLGFAAVALIGILLLLQAAYQSWRLATLSLLTLPLALVGGLVMLATAEAQSLSLGAVFGLLAVFGLAARNQILLIRRFRQLKQDHEKTTRLELTLQGTREQFGSILMTTLTIAMALLPLLLMGNIAGLEVLRPTALVILGGLATAALVNLFVVPSLYLRLAPADIPSQQ
jgi:Cu/Ag efflux pump CusA